MYLWIYVGRNNHGRALAVGAAGLVVIRLVLDHPALSLLEQRPANLQLPYRALAVCTGGEVRQSNFTDLQCRQREAAESTAVLNTQVVQHACYILYQSSHTLAAMMWKGSPAFYVWI